MLELDFAIDRTGQLEASHVDLYSRLGNWLAECYDRSHALAAGVLIAGLFNGFVFNANVSFLVNAMSSVFLVLYIGIFAYSSLLERKRLKAAKAEIATKNDELMDSIRYAETLQQAMLTLEGPVLKRLQEHFILFRPRDLVSGDFYWMAERENKLIKAPGTPWPVQSMAATMSLFSCSAIQ